jgi:hypothetical protein
LLVGAARRAQFLGQGEDLAATWDVQGVADDPADPPQKRDDKIARAVGRVREALLGLAKELLDLIGLEVAGLLKALEFFAREAAESRFREHYRQELLDHPSRIALAA